MGPTLGTNFCHGFYLSLDGMSIWPTVLWMENAENVDVVLVGRFIHKEDIWGEFEKINFRIGRDTDKKNSTINKNNVKYKQEIPN